MTLVWSPAPTEGDVQTLVRTWKTLISKEVGQSIWQRSYYDHVIRSEQEYVKFHYGELNFHDFEDLNDWEKKYHESVYKVRKEKEE